MGDIEVATPVPAPLLFLRGLSSTTSVPLHASPRSDPTQDSLVSLPSGYPSRLRHSAAWVPENFVKEASYVYHLSIAEQAELRQAKDDFKGTYLFQGNPHF
jgi:hypothetical protein